MTNYADPDNTSETHDDDEDKLKDPKKKANASPLEIPKAPVRADRVLCKACGANQAQHVSGSGGCVATGCAKFAAI